MKKFICLAAIALLAAACNKVPEKTPDYSENAIAVQPVITRATETNFENGDAIGLTVTRATGVHADNARLAFDGTAFKGDVKWYAEGAEGATLAAYYPYAETRPATFTVAADQSAGGASSDFISAVKENVYPTPGEVTMVFKHRLARLVLDVKNMSGSVIDAFTVKGAIPTAVIGADLTATVDGTAAPADIKAWKNGDSWYVILPAQTVSLTIAATVGDKTLEQRLAEAALTEGKQYTAHVIVNPEGLQVVLSGEIDNWDNGGELSPYNGAQEVAFEEHLDENYFLYDGERYSVKKLSNNRWIMTQSMRFVPAGKTVSDNPADGNGIWYPYSSDGTNITVDKSEEAAAARGYLYDHPTAFAAEITAENFKDFEGIQGICPKGWHIPTLDEFVAIFGASNSPDGSTAIVDETAVYYDPDYKAARIKTVNANGFNFDFPGSIMRNTNTATGKYQATIAKSTTCSVAEWLGKNAVSYYIGSTGHTPANTETNRQFMSLMSTFTAAYGEGKLSVGYSNYLSGNALRCIRNVE